MPRTFTTRIPLDLMIACVLCPTMPSLAGPPRLQTPVGEALPGLTPAELARFHVGRDRFEAPVTVGDGLGPIFNKPSCYACHGAPLGWIDVIGVSLFTTEEGPTAQGGPLYQTLAISASCSEVPPVNASFGFRVTTSALGGGLIEAIPDAAILALADPNDADGDGISGRAHVVTSLEDPATPRVGRFGWKARWATLLSASASEAQQKMGLTNRLIPFDEAPNGDPTLLAECDAVADPEDVQDAEGLGFIDRVADFQRFLAAPPQAPRGGMSGEAIFTSIGCAQCHVPAWTTADDPALPTALRNRSIRPYSDFLLHDMGALGGDLPEGDAQASEYRTTPLWDLRRKVIHLHDGSVSGGTFADRMTLVIAAHGPFGEGAASAEAFEGLDSAEQASVIAFLDSLGRLDFDVDGNGVIDLTDFAVFADCFGARGVSPDDLCGISDVDQDGSISLVDAELFVASAESLAGDCDHDGVANLIEILLGAPDRNGDGVPDVCDPCVADLDRDGAVGSSDLAMLLGAWGGPAGDLDGDGLTGSLDLAVLLGAWGACSG